MKVDVESRLVIESVLMSLASANVAPVPYRSHAYRFTLPRWQWPHRRHATYIVLALTLPAMTAVRAAVAGTLALMSVREQRSSRTGFIVGATAYVVSASRYRSIRYVTTGQPYPPEPASEQGRNRRCHERSHDQRVEQQAEANGGAYRAERLQVAVGG